MFESVKDQIKYERREGLDSNFVDAHRERPGRLVDDGWLSPVPWDAAKEADVWTMHSFIPAPLKELFSQKVSVAVLHGPTEHMTLYEWASNREKTTFNLHVTILWQYDATVVLNKHEYDIMVQYDEHNRLHYIPNSIDIERVMRKGPVWEYQHHPAIISCDVPRLEKLPHHIIWSMPAVHNIVPDARLNLFSLTLEPIATWRNLFARAKKRNLEALCENIQLQNNDLLPFMRGADVGWNNNISGIMSRVSMEMMACGVPVVSYGGNQNGAAYTRFVAHSCDLDSIALQVTRCCKELAKRGQKMRDEARQFVVKNCNRAVEVKRYVALYETLCKTKYGKGK